MDTSPGPPGSADKRLHLPRWWRRGMVAARRVNVYRWLEVAAAGVLVVMLATSYVALSRADPARLLPSGQAAAMLVGTLIPA